MDDGPDSPASRADDEESVIGGSLFHCYTLLYFLNLNNTTEPEC